MAVARWPSGVPQRMVVAGYSEGLAKSLIRSETDAGPAKVRRRSTATPWSVSGSLVVSDANYATILAFIDDDIAGGALPFEFPNQKAVSGYWLVRLVPEDFQATRLGPRWQIAMKLEVLP